MYALKTTEPALLIDSALIIQRPPAYDWLDFTAEWYDHTHSHKLDTNYNRLAVALREQFGEMRTSIEYSAIATHFLAHVYESMNATLQLERSALELSGVAMESYPVGDFIWWRATVYGAVTLERVYLSDLAAVVRGMLA